MIRNEIVMISAWEGMIRNEIVMPRQVMIRNEIVMILA
jgi:hypothetical protein